MSIVSNYTFYGEPINMDDSWLKNYPGIGAYYQSLLIERQCVSCATTKHHYGLCGVVICDKCNNGMYVMSYHKVDANGLILIVEET